MADEKPGIDYQALLRRAFREVVREVLAQVAHGGFPGAHHAYLTFRTDHPGATVPEDLRREYPDEMTIVLQHRFEDLEVDGDGFAVTLSFGGRPSRLRVPFEALVAFVDPEAELGLRLGPSRAAANSALAGAGPAADGSTARRADGPGGRVLSFGDRRPERDD